MNKGTNATRNKQVEEGRKLLNKVAKKETQEPKKEMKEPKKEKPQKRKKTAKAPAKTAPTHEAQANVLIEPENRPTEPTIPATPATHHYPASNPFASTAQQGRTQAAGPSTNAGA